MEALTWVGAFFVCLGSMIDNMQQALIYSFRVWLTSVFLPPVISDFIFVFFDRGAVLDIITLYTIQVMVSLFLSFCSFLLLFIFTYLFAKQSFKERSVKIMMSFIGFLLALAPIMWLTKGDIDLDRDLVYYLPYPLVVVGSIWFYKLQQMVVTNSDLN